MRGSPIFTGSLAAAGSSDTVVSLLSSGLTCDVCGGPCHRLLSAPRAAIGLRGPGAVQIVRCLNCIFRGRYYVEFESEVPTRVVVVGDSECHDFIEQQCDPVSEASLCWTPGPPPAEEDWTHTVAGGEPAWLQRPEWPACLRCERSMGFTLQLSSDSLDTLLRNRDLADGFAIEIEYYATLFLFECPDCAVTCTVSQCT